MNGTADNLDESSWDALAADLGLDPAPPPPPPRREETPPAPKAPAPVARKIETPPSVDEEFFGVLLAEAAPVEAKPTPMSEEADIGPNDDTVLDESLELLDAESSEGDTAGDGSDKGDGKGRKRRRRRRRKSGDGPAVENASASESAPVAAPVRVVERLDQDPAEIVGEAAAEMEDDDEQDDIVTPAAMEEDLANGSTEPLPEWKVTSWTDLCATLYRPQDR